MPALSVLTLTKLRRKALTLFGTTQARSSVVEHYIDTVGVGSSILPAPTVLLVDERLRFERVSDGAGAHKMVTVVVQ
jgi:hypothetical protein